MKNAKRNAVMLALCDFAGKTEAEVKEQVVREYEATQAEVDRFKFLIAYQCDGSYDGESSFLLEEKSTGKLFEVHASHCSCYGWEGSWKPEATTAEYLLSQNSGRFSYTPEMKEYIAENIRLTTTKVAV